MIFILRKIKTRLLKLVNRIDTILKARAVSKFDSDGRIYACNSQIFHIPGPPLTDVNFRYRFIAGGYESADEYGLVRQHLVKDGAVLELGGCLGVMSCYINSLLEFPDRHVVFEPNPNLIEYLEKNRESNKCTYKIVASLLMDGKKVDFHLHDLIVGGSTKRITDNVVTVQSKSSDDYVDFDNLIIDIEGGELDLLRNHAIIFRTAKVVFIEIHPFAGIMTTEEACECEQLLFEMGFKKTATDQSGNYQVWKR